MLKKVVLFSLILDVHLAFSCDCIQNKSTDVIYAESDYVATGEILLGDIIDSPNKQELIGSFTPTKIFKGDVNYLVNVAGDKPPFRSPCGRQLTPGHYLIYASGNQVQISACSYSIKTDGMSQEYIDYQHQYLDHLLKIRLGKASDFKPKLNYGELSEFFKPHQEKLSSIFLKYKKKVKFVDIKLFIKKDGSIYNFEIQDNSLNNGKLKMELSEYLKNLKLRESYQDEEKILSIWLDK